MKPLLYTSAIGLLFAISCGSGNAPQYAQKYADKINGRFITCSESDSDGDGYVFCKIEDDKQNVRILHCGTGKGACFNTSGCIEHTFQEK